MVQRTKRQLALTSPATLLDQVAPAHRDIVSAMARLQISGAHYRALDAAREALARLAADLGHPGRLSGAGHSTPGPRE